MKKRLLLFVIAVSLFAPTGKFDVVAAPINVMEGADKDIIAFADVIVKKYRIYKGQMQYRRWNETSKYWVDSSWINM